MEEFFAKRLQCNELFSQDPEIPKHSSNGKLVKHTKTQLRSGWGGNVESVKLDYTFWAEESTVDISEGFPWMPKERSGWE